jgi:hypothetical protein
MRDVDENFERIEQAIDTLNANASLQQAGSITLQLTSGVGSGTVTFPTEYPTNPPYIVLTPVVGTLGNKLNFGIRNITKTGFDIVCERGTDYNSVTFHWIAVPR